ncbi:MAG TPA: retroviral-like aspartic protease family protein, partial [Pyrinomonadaceae bacterium]|nr:retroviral-like aspartic protease family protein [Pyrinomonadaceae bacterium]
LNCMLTTALGLCLLGSDGIAQSQRSSAPVEVPFEFESNQIILQVKIAGKGPFNMLLDTNTDPSAIDSATARDLGLVVGSKGTTASGGGTETNTVYPVRLPNVEVGPVVAKDVPAATIDLTRLGNRIGKPIHGVLGYSFLKDRIVQIDYPNSKLRFFAESPYPRIQFGPNTVNIIAFPFRYEDGDVIIDSVYINNEKMKASLDTGSSSTFCLTPDAVALLGLEEQGRDSDEENVGYNGAYKSKVGMLKSVRLGKLSVDSAPATFWLPGTGHDHKKFQVNIGNGFFKDFMMTFDFRNKMVVFERVD